MAAHAHHREHHHGHVHIDEADWRASAAHTELDGEVLLAFVTDTAAWITELRGPDAPPVGRGIDIGSGPGVGTCELARLFPEAQVIAVDSSAEMLDRTTQRAVAQGLEARISTHIAELPSGLDGFGRADVIWASMALHHIGDEVTSLRVLRQLLDPYGLIAIAELGEPMRVLPDDLDVGRPGLVERLDSAGATWFADMREGLTDSVPSTISRRCSPRPASKWSVHDSPASTSTLRYRPTHVGLRLGTFAACASSSTNTSTTMISTRSTC
jgi:SAM-dependent methyltransferase